MRVLVLGASGMLGYAVYNVFSGDPSVTSFGTIRSAAKKQYFPEEMKAGLVSSVDANDFDSVIRVMARVRPDIVINCIGVIKQVAAANDPLYVLPLNSMFPHRLAALCESSGARLIHISTDCVFSGEKGGYTENDVSDARDLYGKSKYIGEVSDSKAAVTLRTSIIGHEIESADALVDWFLSQDGEVNGFTKAIFSGLPVNHLASVIKKHVIPDSGLCGLYHVSAQPISKYDLLALVADVYGKNIRINRSDDVVIDRSLDSTRFSERTGYSAPDWRTLVRQLADYHESIKGLLNVQG